MAKCHGYYCDHCRYETVEPEWYPCSDCVYSEFQTKPPSEWAEKDIAPSIKDSGERTVYPNGFQRDMHRGKGRMDLLPWNAIIEVSKHCENGAIKYGEHNVDLGCPVHSLMDSGMRHAAKFITGQLDEPHLTAACWNLLWALEMTLTNKDMVDIPWKPKVNEDGDG